MNKINLKKLIKNQLNAIVKHKMNQEIKNAYKNLNRILIMLEMI